MIEHTFVTSPSFSIVGRCGPKDCVLQPTESAEYLARLCALHTKQLVTRGATRSGRVRSIHVGACSERVDGEDSGRPGSEAARGSRDLLLPGPLSAESALDSYSQCSLRCKQLEHGRLRSQRRFFCRHARHDSGAARACRGPFIAWMGVYCGLLGVLRSRSRKCGRGCKGWMRREGIAMGIGGRKWLKDEAPRTSAVARPSKVWIVPGIALTVELPALS